MTHDPAALRFDWQHVQYQEAPGFTDVYGFSGSQGAVNLEGILIRPPTGSSRTLLIFMHPASTLQLLPLPRSLAATGAHVLCAASRYARNDTPLILEKVVLDLGAWVRHARQTLGYAHVVIVGWSGGGSLALMYQAQAESPDITHTPAGDPADMASAALLPADAVVFQAAHLSRGHLLAESIDPSVRDELAPDEREVALDIYSPANPAQPPYTADYVARHRAAQLARVRRITAWARAQLDALKARGTAEVERGFIVHRTLADPRFLDPALEPNGRRPGWCYLGKPETVNSGPVGLARFSTLRAWLSQWSIDDSNGNGLRNAARMRAPLLVIENGADDAVPPSHPQALFAAAAGADKTYARIEGANHYYAGQPAQLAEAGQTLRDWLGARGMGR
jgi:alpha-beta hydrolase superfamily lysophospholipase